MLVLLTGEMNNYRARPHMKTGRTIALSLLMLTVSHVDWASETARTDINPALLYYQAFLLAPEPMSSSDMDYLFSQPGRSQPLPDRFGNIFTSYDSQFKLVRQAAQARVPCDWGIDLTAGPGTLLPHLARCKGVIQAARFRVMWELQHGQQAEARDDLLAAMALGRNTSRDGTLISALVQIATEAIACSTVAEDFGQFSPETLQQLADGLEALPARGTVAQSMTTEKACFHDWLERKVVELKQESGGDEKKAMAAIQQLFASMEGGDEGDVKRQANEHWTQVLRASGGTSDGIIKMLAEESRYYDELAVVAALPYSEFAPQMAAFREKIKKSGYAFTLLPALEKSRSREFRVQATLAMVRAAIEYKLHGQAGFEAVADPCGQGQPFGFERFIFQGVDRGFKLTSAYNMFGNNVVLIFVEGEGPAFRVDGPHAGEALLEPGAQK
jgi:hypothetical protein